LLRITVKLSNDGSSKLLCYKKPWYQGKNPNLAVKFGFRGDGTIFAENCGRQNNNLGRGRSFGALCFIKLKLLKYIIIIIIIIIINYC
jgi:hypothetical protein